MKNRSIKSGVHFFISLLGTIIGGNLGGSLWAKYYILVDIIINNCLVDKPYCSHSGNSLTVFIFSNEKEK